MDLPVRLVEAASTIIILAGAGVAFVGELGERWRDLFAHAEEVTWYVAVHNLSPSAQASV